MKNLIKLTSKTYVASLLVVLAIIGGFQVGFNSVYLQLILAIVTAVALDSVIKYLKTKRIVFSSSAFITGMIIALVLAPEVKWYIPVIASAIAVLQKHIISFRGKHIFNPANFGLLSMIFIFSAIPSWWGQSPWQLILLVGIFICYMMKRIKIPIVFVAVFAFLLSLNSLITGQSLGNPLIFINFFFVFIMLIEPKTIPATKNGRIIYAVLVASLSFIFFKLIPQYDYSILALAGSNMFVPFFNKLK